MKRIKKSLMALLLILTSIGLLTLAETGILPVNTSPAPKISAQQAALMDGKTGELIYEKNIDEKAYPASTTKIMTALITIETLQKLNSDIKQKVRIPESVVGTEGSSLYLKKDEIISLEDLLYGLMLCSGNDAAEALAEIIGGTREHFIKMMNKRAQEIGCRNTHFTNPHGLFDKSHSTTARDMALMAKEAMKNNTFRKIVSAKSKKAERGKNPYSYFYNKNKTIHQFKGATGIKIGYTKDTGRTLVASAKRNKKELICVVMNAPNWFADAYKLMEWGFEGET